MPKFLISLCLLSWCCALSITAQQSAPPEPFTFKPDQSVYVVAVETSADPAISSRFRWMPPSWNKAVLDCVRMDQPGNISKSNHPALNVPVPTGSQGKDGRDKRATLEPDPPRRPTLDPDPIPKLHLAAKKEIEEIFRKQKKFRIADSPETADFVFWVDVRYIAHAPSGVAIGYGGGKTYDARTGKEVERSQLMGAFALVMSPALYLEKQAQPQALLDGARWRGLSLEGNDIQALFERKQSQLPASLPDLVNCFHKQALKK